MVLPQNTTDGIVHARRRAAISLYLGYGESRMQDIQVITGLSIENMPNVSYSYPNNLYCASQCISRNA